MPSSLGLYIEDNLIKYAKVSRNNDSVKVESFGVKFYDNIEIALKLIVEETYSFKIPININTSDEWYNKIHVFSLLTKKDMEDSIKTEFENICYEKELSKNLYEQRIIYTNSNTRTDDKIKVIDIAVPRTSIEQRKNQFVDYRVDGIIPTSVAIANLANKGKKGTVLVINIEKDTTITKIKNGAISDIESFEIGTQEILEKISKKENSFSKAYDICKRTTIYTETDKDLQYEENEYLEDIMPTLYEIVSKVRKYADENIEKVEKIYITGTGAIINNIDIYFQEYFRDVQCEILKPDFISNNSKINIKDYIEVNSAIAIALKGLEKNNKDINFKSEPPINKLFSMLNSNISDARQLEVTRSFGNFLDRFSRPVNTGFMLSILLIVLYLTGSLAIDAQFDSKAKEIETAIANTNEKIEKIQEYNKKFDSQVTTYKNVIKNIQNLSDANTENKRYRNSIPNLLNNIMAVIPTGVQLTLIENTSDSHIVIKARTNEYQEIAYLKTKLSTEKILKNVVSDTGTSDNGYLLVTIEGELP